MKHAYLIIASSDFIILNELVRALDFPNNELYIHIDRKSKIEDCEAIKKNIHFAQIWIYREMKVFWGSESQVFCELFLMRKAKEHGNHDYYHILSGVDFPIKSNAEIDAFFRRNQGKEFIHFDSAQIGPRVKERVTYYHIFNHGYKFSRIKLIHRMNFILDDLCVYIQKILHIRRALPFAKIQKGCNWCSITQGFVDFILDQEENIRRFVFRSKCADELFIQTLAINSSFADKLYSNSFNNDYQSCARLIIWDEQHIKSPKTLSLEDFDAIMESKALFARKFSSLISLPLIRKIMAVKMKPE